MKRTKLVASLILCVMCLSFLVADVWATVLSVNYDLNAGLKYYPEGVYIELSGQVYRGDSTVNLKSLTSDPRFTLEPITNFDDSTGVLSGNFPMESWNIGNITFVPVEKFVKIEVNVRNLSEFAITGTPNITVDDTDISTLANLNISDNGSVLSMIKSAESVTYELIIEVTGTTELTKTLNVSFNFEPLYIIENTDEYNYIYFGKYPQTYVGDTMNSVLENEWYPTLTDEDIVDAYTVNTYSNGSGTTVTYNAYTYTDNNTYVRVPSAHVYASGDQTFNDGTRVTTSSTYWFKVEPIKWRVLTENYTDAENLEPVSYLLSEYLLLANTGWGTNGVDFANSNNILSSFLNIKFYNDAFTENEKSLLTTRILTPQDLCPNSGYAPSYSSNPLNVWLPTSSDMSNSNYSFVENEDKLASLTDFAMVNYAYKLNGFCDYWTSSVSAPPYVYYISSSGVIGSYREDITPYWSQGILAMRPAILFDI